MPSKKRKVKQVLYLRFEQVQKLKKRAKQQDVPMSQLLRDAVDEFLKK
jgi:ribbon-helix-helix protein